MSASGFLPWAWLSGFCKIADIVPGPEVLRNQLLLDWRFPRVLYSAGVFDQGMLGKERLSSCPHGAHLSLSDSSGNEPKVKSNTQ